MLAGEDLPGGAPHFDPAGKDRANHSASDAGAPAAIARPSAGAEAPPADSAGDANGHDRGGTKAARAGPRRMPTKLARALAKSMERRHIQPRRYDQPFTIVRVTRFAIRQPEPGAGASGFCLVVERDGGVLAAVFWDGRGIKRFRRSDAGAGVTAAEKTELLRLVGTDGGVEHKAGGAGGEAGAAAAAASRDGSGELGVAEAVEPGDAANDRDEHADRGEPGDGAALLPEDGRAALDGEVIRPGKGLSDEVNAAHDELVAGALAELGRRDRERRALEGGRRHRGLEHAKGREPEPAGEPATPPATTEGQVAPEPERQPEPVPEVKGPTTGKGSLEAQLLDLCRAYRREHPGVSTEEIAKKVYDVYGAVVQGALDEGARP